MVDINILKQIAKDSMSKSDMCRHLQLAINGNNMRKVSKLIEEYSLDITHFDGGRKKCMKYERVTKVCPVCTKPFITMLGHSREKSVCSHSCSNTYFRSGEEHPNWKDGYRISYRSICFQHHPHKCVCCNEDKIVEVHHLDGNRNNNHKDNLIPLCPTHHSYWHSKYRYIVQPIIEKYLASIK